MTAKGTGNINILYFVPFRLSVGLGGGARFRNILGALEQIGANIQLISYMPEVKFGVGHTRVNDRIRATTISVKRTSTRIVKAFSLVLIFYYGLKYIKKSNIIFAHAPVIPSGFPAVILSKLFRKPVVTDLTDLKEPATPRFVYDMVLKNSTVVFTVSHYLEEKAKAMGCRNVVQVPIIIDTDVFHHDAHERTKIRKELGINDDEIVIGYAGSYSTVEGVPVLLKAYKKLRTKYKNIRLLLVGGRNVPDSDDVPQLVRDLAIEGCTITIPSQQHDMMPKYLSAFDIACAPKIECEGNKAASPIKIHEYMSMALPMVVSSIGEIAQVIEDKVDGYLVKPGDETDLEKALEYVIKHLDSAREVGEKARKKIIRDFNQRETIKPIANTLNDLFPNSR